MAQPGLVDRSPGAGRTSGAAGIGPAPRRVRPGLRRTTGAACGRRGRAPSEPVGVVARLGLRTSARNGSHRISPGPGRGARMPRVLRRLAVIAVLALLVAAWPARAAAPTVDADAYIVVEPATGEVLAQRAPDRGLPMASTTKIMTALIVLESADLEDVMTVPPEAAVGGSSGRLEAGEQLSVRDLLTALLVASGNDAAITLAEGVAGSQEAFVARMNRRARELGLTEDALREPARPRCAGPPVERPRPRGPEPRGDEEPRLPRDGVAPPGDDPRAGRRGDPRVPLREPPARHRPGRRRREDGDDGRRRLRARRPRPPPPGVARAVRGAHRRPQRVGPRPRRVEPARPRARPVRPRHPHRRGHGLRPRPGRRPSRPVGPLPGGLPAGRAAEAGRARHRDHHRAARDLGAGRGGRGDRQRHGAAGRARARPPRPGRRRVGRRAWPLGPRARRVRGARP